MALLGVLASKTSTPQAHFSCDSERDEMKKYTASAITQQYHDVLTVLWESFGEWTRKLFCEFGSFAVRDVALDRFLLVWPYLRDDGSFMTTVLKDSSIFGRNKVVEHIIQDCHSRATGQNEAVLKIAICRDSQRVFDFWMKEKVDTRRILTEKGNIDMIARLLERDRELYPGQGMLAGLLKLAFSPWNFRKAEYLLDQGAGIHEVSLDTAIESKWKKGIKCLLQSGSRDFRSSQFGTVFQRVCMDGHWDTAQSLLEYGHAINPSSPMASGGNSPLTGAIIGDTPKFKFGNALQMACYVGRKDIVDMILDRDPDVETFFPLKATMCAHAPPTPLALAIDSRDKEIVQTLLAKGAAQSKLSDYHQGRLAGLLGEICPTE
ncbi:hypothetical protein BDW74DRAFT_180209 [Aspergillus multicolor]|uniref:ankyrin repeat domain-containing protein n=1 Tax=Aspergillus multicolor TaxID=41759 RepID=UPI003CCD0165